MSKNELERVKEDLEVIKEAAGLELPFGWDAVFVHTILFPVAAACCLVYRLISDKPSRFWAVVPFAIVLAVQGYLWFKYRRSTGRSAVKRREWGFSFYSNIVIGAVAGFYLLWARHVGLNTVHTVAGIILMIGVTGILMASHMRGRLYYLGSSIPLILFGVSLLIWISPVVVVVNACITFFVGGLASGAIQMYQLKQIERKNGAN